MHKWRLRTAATAVLGCLWFAAGITASQAALVVDGPIEALPGELVTLSIGLDAALAADIDELQLLLEFDPAVLHPQAAASGSLLAGALVLADADTGTAIASFLATLTTLGPGELATWTFRIDPTVTPFTQMSVRARLDTFVIDSIPTASLSSVAHVITAIPEPASSAMMMLGVCLLGPYFWGQACIPALLRRRVSRISRVGPA